MKTIYKVLALTLLVFSAMSCIVDNSTYTKRSSYALMDYSETNLGSIYVFEPALVVAVARTADIYLSLSEEERKNFDINSVFHDGIRHIDQNSINMPGEGSIYSDGTSINVPGAKWRLKLRPSALNQWYYNILYDAYYDYSHVEYELECIAASTWTITYRKTGLYDDKAIEPESGQLKIYLDGETDEGATYRVVSYGKDIENDDLYAESRTGDEGITIKYIRRFKSEDGENSLSDAKKVADRPILKPVSGTLYVSFYKNGSKVDYCNITYLEDGSEFDLSI